MSDPFEMPQVPKKVEEPIIQNEEGVPVPEKPKFDLSVEPSDVRVSADSFIADDPNVASWVAIHERPTSTSEFHAESEQAVALLEEMFANIERTHDVEALYAITHLTTEEAKVHPVRAPVKNALFEIDMKMKFLKDNSDVSPEAVAWYNERRKKFSHALGVIVNGIVDHTR